MEETELPWFLVDQQTLYTGNVGSCIIQLTPTYARVINASEKRLVSEWRPPANKSISVVACNGGQAVCAAASDIYYLEVIDNEIFQKK